MFYAGKDLSVENLDYADDIALLAETLAEAQHFLDNVASTVGEIGLRVGGPKTKVISDSFTNPVIKLGDVALENGPIFVLLGSTLSDHAAASSEDLNSRIGKPAGGFARLKNCIWKCANISIQHKDEDLQRRYHYDPFVWR